MISSGSEKAGSNIDETPHYRETEPIELWSTVLHTRISFPEFERTVSIAAKTSDQRFTGYITRDENGYVTSFTRTRYPRKKYGVASVNECMSGMSSLASNLGGDLLPDPRQSGFRVTFGLIEGYDPKAPTHTLEEVQKALPECIISPAEVFVCWPSDDHHPTYTEPIAIIDGPLEVVYKVYYLADRFKQERITIEDFDRKITYVVETRHCTEPD